MTDKLWRAQRLWRDGAWQSGARLAVDKLGRVAADAPGNGQDMPGQFVLPGMVNVHSHAFQRAMAGRVERRQAGRDNFWSWRELMYGFAERIGPDELHAVARQLYLEMLQGGYTRVCEFHYVHNRPDGGAYDDPAAMSLALVEAAREVGIGLTLLPVLYMTGGFDGRALSARQQRFGLSVDAFLDLLRRLSKVDAPGFAHGIALHSLRAVPPDALQEVLASSEACDVPIHIHIAEQPAEVEACMQHRGTRPVAWLMDHAEVDSRWCLVHATHVDAEEMTRMAASGAAVGLCPTTEANLGDGIFPLRSCLDAGGSIAVGSDSNVSVSAVEELRWLEYGQRLATGDRLVAATAHASVGETLWQAALEGGSRAAGQPQALQLGASADCVVLDDESPLLAGQDSHSVLDGLVFAGNQPLVRDVMVAGQWRLRGFHHAGEERISAGYRKALQRLLAD